LLKADASAASGYVSKVGGDTVVASGAAVKPLVLKGASSQTANLQEWQDSTGAVVASVSPTGNIVGGGLVHINTTTFTTQSSISLNNIFTSTYSNYRIVFHLSAKSTNGHMFLRFRASGADNSTGNYNYGGLLGRTTNATANYGASGAGDIYFAFSNASQVFAALDVINPQIALNTQVAVTGHGGDLSTWFSVNGSGNFTTNAQFDGITFAPSTGTISGTVQVYGYRNA
jgi:hypothetical protein